MLVYIQVLGNVTLCRLVADVLRQCGAFMFRAKHPKKACLGLVDPDDDGTTAEAGRPRK